MPGANKLVKQKIDSALEAFTQGYSAAFNNAPRLPNKPPEGFKFITSAALKQEAYEVAPMVKPTLAAEGKLLEGRLLRINVLYRKSVEFRLLHVREHERLTKLLKILQYTMLGITSGVSIILLVFPNEPWVTQVSSIATIVVGLIVSWGRFQSYEARAEGHMISSLDFESLARDMSTYLATCRPEQIDEEAMDSLHRLANEPDGAEASFLANGGAKRDEVQQYPTTSSGPGPVAEADEVTTNTISAHLGFGGSSSRSLLRPSPSMMQLSPETSLDRSQRNQRLQLWYHKSVEYRLANNIFCERNKRISMVFGFVSMILTGVIQAVLVMGTDNVLKTASAVISAVLTAINAIAARGNFDGRAQVHAVSMRDFAKLQWELASSLLTSSSEMELHEFGPLSVQFNNAIASMPVLDNKYMKKQRTSDGKKLFEYITEDALRKEAEANPSEQALENLKQAYRTISTTGFAGSATSDLRNSAKIHPFPDGGV